MSGSFLEVDFWTKFHIRKYLAGGHAFGAGRVLFQCMHQKAHLGNVNALLSLYMGWSPACYPNFSHLWGHSQVVLFNIYDV